MDFMKLDKLLVIDDVIVLATIPPTSVSRIPAFFDVDQRNFERQVGMREDSREVDQFVEEVEERASLRAEPAVDDAASLRFRFHQPFANDDRFDDQHPVLGRQIRDLVSNRRQRAVLNLDQFPIANDVDSVTPQLMLNFRAVIGVKFLELFVKRAFHRPLSQKEKELLFVSVARGHDFDINPAKRC